MYVLAGVRALRLRSLRRVRVFAAAVAGSAFVDGAEGCALHLAARQVRIHGATDTDFYLVRLLLKMLCFCGFISPTCSTSAPAARAEPSHH